MASDLETRIRNVTAVLGPTNTGKTHLAIERMLAHESGLIGLPLRLLAREVYDKVVARVGKDRVALITGEEKIKPERARYWVSTVEAMPRDLDVDFLAIDEIQLAADPERGHTFTDRLLHARGRSETLLLGAQTMRDAIQDLIPDANFISRPRLSKLTYAGEKKITRLPARTAVVAFSTAEVYALAELIRRQRGGAAVVLGALSPRTRNAQVAMYQSGDVDYLVATDAIGMGLNLNVDHVAFAAVRKFDGHSYRNLTPAELAQIGGRAGRHLNDGTFGVTGDAEPFDADLVERLESHTFEPVKLLQWRNRRLEFSSLAALKASLKESPGAARLVRARTADDLEALETVSQDPDVARLASAPAAVAKLWDVCQVPDYRKISSASHAEMIASLYKSLLGPEERISEDWFAKQVALSDRTDGDIDTLSNRIAHIRTWTFVANRSDWLRDPVHWQERTRAIEDSLSDALHECLTQRFVDQRTSALMKGMRDKDQLTAEIADDGAITVENHFVGRLKGFRFYPDDQGEGIHGRATRNAAAQVLEQEMAMRSRRVIAAKNDAFKLSRTGAVLWRDEEVAQLTAGEDPLKPTVTLIVDADHLSGPDKERIQDRVQRWVSEYIGEKLKPLVDLNSAEDVSGLAKGIAFRLVEGFGALKRETVADEIKTLDQPSRAQLRRFGVRFGAFNIYLPMLLKPAPAELAATLWTIKHGADNGLDLAALPEPPRAGLTSVRREETTGVPFYRAYGFHVCGPRAVRFDILERLADQIRPLVAWRKKPDATEDGPKGSTGDGGFVVTPEMMSILGCSPDELSDVLKALGFRCEKRKKTAAADEKAPADAAAPRVENEGAASEAGKEALAIAPSETPVGEGETADLAGQTVPAPGETNAAADEPVAKDNTRSDEAPAAADATAPAMGSDAQAHGVTSEIAAVDANEPVAEAAVTNAAVQPVGAVGDAAASESAGAEDAFEEIWRPRRHRRHDNRQGRGRAAAGAQTGAGDGAAAADGAGDGLHQPRRGSGGRRHQAGGGTKTSEGGSGDARRSSGPQRGKGPKRSGSGGPPGGGRRDRNRDDNRKRSPVHSSAPSRKGKGGVDPDSPFAALGALRESLKSTSGDAPSSGDDKKP